MPELDSIFETIETAEEQRAQAEEMIDDAVAEVEKAVADVYGYDADDVEAEYKRDHHFTVEIDTGEKGHDLESRLDDDYLVNTSFTVSLHAIEAQIVSDDLDDLQQLIEHLEQHYDDGAPVERVHQHASRHLGIPEQKVAEKIEKLRRAGEVYEPRADRLRTP